MPPPLKPRPGLRGIGVIKQGGSGAPEMASGMEEIEDSYGTVGKASAIDAPKARSTVTQPNDLRGGCKGLLGGFQLKLGNELVNIAQYRDQSTV